MKRTVNGVQIHYRVDGPEGAPWLTMSNSLATTHRMWDAQMDAFTKAYRVLRYDKRGHGETDVAPGPYSFELLAHLSNLEQPEAFNEAVLGFLKRH